MQFIGEFEINSVVGATIGRPPKNGLKSMKRAADDRPYRFLPSPNTPTNQNLTTKPSISLNIISFLTPCVNRDTKMQENFQKILDLRIKIGYYITVCL